MSNTDFTISALRSVAIDADALRAELHGAVDTVVDRLLGLPSDARSGAVGGEEPRVEAGESFRVWMYRWPDKQEEEFTSGREYYVRCPEGDLRVRLAWTIRKAWGRNRGRAIVFQHVGASDSNTYYPLAEFVESDEPGHYASTIPDPARPRALVAEGATLPARYRAARVERADKVFRTIENGPSLRLVVEQDDEVEMVRHGYWVARIRGRI